MQVIVDLDNLEELEQAFEERDLKMDGRLAKILGENLESFKECLEVLEAMNEVNRAKAKVSDWWNWCGNTTSPEILREDECGDVHNDLCCAKNKIEDALYREINRMALAFIREFLKNCPEYKEPSEEK